MDEISRQLKSEIQALQEYIERTADRYLATVWVSQMLPAFGRLEDDLDEVELRQVLAAFHHAQHHFAVNGLLSPQLQSVLDRYQEEVAGLPELLAPGSEPEERNDVTLFPESDPDLSAPEATHLLFEEEDEEVPEAAAEGPPTASAEEGFTPLAFPAEAAADAGPAPPPEAAIAGGDHDRQPAAEPDEGADAALTALFGARSAGPSNGEDRAPAEAAPEVSPAAGDDPVVSELFAVDKPVFSEEPPPAATEPSPAPAAPPEADRTDELFRSPSPDARPAPKVRKPDPPRPPSTPSQAPPTAKKVPRRTIARTPPVARKEPELQYDIFAAKVSLDELQAGLGISLPKQDLANLQVRLRDKIVSDEIPALSASKNSEGQYILMPRVARFVYKGEPLPCTVKNLAKLFPGLFGDIRDLVRFRDCSFMSYDYPELGWVLITAESIREGLDKNYMEQNQALRYLATSSGVPSHRLRRRTLVEAIYDLIVGRLVLGRRLQQHTVDWTASGASKNEFVCLYYPPEGIRVRDLPRTARHRSLGVCPNW